jgi:hypothetical protein
MVEAIAASGLANRASGEAGAWQAIAERATTVMLDEQDAGKLARLLKTSAELAGYSQPRQEQEQAGSVSDLFAAVPPGALLVLARRIGQDEYAFDNSNCHNHEAEHGGDVLDSTATDAPDAPTP